MHLYQTPYTNTRVEAEDTVSRPAVGCLQVTSHQNQNCQLGITRILPHPPQKSTPIRFQMKLLITWYRRSHPSEVPTGILKRLRWRRRRWSDTKSHLLLSVYQQHHYYWEAHTHRVTWHKWMEHWDKRVKQWWVCFLMGNGNGQWMNLREEVCWPGVTKHRRQPRRGGTEQCIKCMPEGSKRQLFLYDFNSPREDFMGVGKSSWKRKGLLVRDSVATVGQCS